MRVKLFSHSCELWRILYAEKLKQFYSPPNVNNDLYVSTKAHMYSFNKSLQSKSPPGLWFLEIIFNLKVLFEFNQVPSQHFQWWF